jgi:type II secretion system protein N
MNKNLKRLGWIFFGLTCLILFTLIKIPREPLKNNLDAAIAQALAPHGASLSAQQTDLSFFLTPSYDLKRITLSLPPPSRPVQIEELKISALFWPLFLARVGAQVQVTANGGHLNSSLATRGSHLWVSFQADQLDLGKLGALPLLAGIQGTATLQGTGALSGDAQNLASLDGELKLQLAKLTLDPQSIEGFALPQLNIAEASAHVTVSDGKAMIHSLKLGKTATDDIQATISGEITLGKTVDLSSLNLKTKFSFSENLLKSFLLLDTLLGAGKQTDGSYAFQLTGTFANPISLPVSPAGGH